MFLKNTVMTKAFEIKDLVMKMKNLAFEGEDIIMSSLR